MWESKESLLPTFIEVIAVTLGFNHHIVGEESI